MATMTKAQMEARIAELEAKVKPHAPARITYKVGAKGGVSVYGLGRFPVTLYAQQWGRLFEQAEGICKFIEQNKDGLAFKE